MDSKEVLNTITGDDWKRELAHARASRNLIAEEIKERLKLKTYRIRYKGTNGGDHEVVADRESSTPVGAINLIHQELQISRGFKPSDYEIVSVAHFYNSDPWGRGGYPMIESTIDLPKSPNPDVGAPTKPSPQPETQVMPFYNEVASREPNAGV